MFSPKAEFNCIRALLIISSLMVSVLLTSCGGGSNSSKPEGSQNGDGKKIEDGNGNTGKQNQSPLNLPVKNPNLSGALYYNNSNHFRRLDLQHGIFTSLRGDGKGPAASSNGKEFAIVYDGVGDDLSDLVIFDEDGLNKQVITFDQYSFGHAKLSPSGSYVVIGRKPYSYLDDSIDGLSIYDRDGNEVRRIEEAEDGPYINSYEWTPEGFLLIAIGDRLFEIQQLPNGPLLETVNLNGLYPKQLAISPNGQQIAFVLRDSSAKNEHVYIMNRDGTGFRQATISDKNEWGVTWSPDGDYLALAHGDDWLGCAGSVCYGDCSDVVIVPANATMLDMENSQEVIHPNVTDNELEITPSCPRSALLWRQYEPLEQKPGQAPQSGGVNNGLTGTIYHSFIDFESVELESGKSTTLRGKGWGITPSDDGSELVGNFENSNYDDWGGIEIFDLQGNVEYAFDIPDYTYGPIRFSPDKQLIGIGQDPSYHFNFKRRLSIFHRQGVDLGEGLDGEVVAQYYGNELGEIGSWDWTNDGGLYLVRGQTIQKVESLGDEEETIVTLPNTPYSMELSPDDSKIAFGMIGSVWIINSDGTDLRRLTVSAKSEGLPHWSPDGRYLALIYYDGNCGNLYAVPADGERVYVGDRNVPTHSFEIKAESSYGQDTFVGFCVDQNVSWK